MKFRSRLPFTCEMCGEEFWLMKSTVKKRAQAGGVPRFCSRTCMGLAYRDRVTKICRICGKQFEVKKCKIDSAKYCSAKCRSEGHRTRPSKTCKICGKVFIGQNKQFCSLRCYRIWQGGLETIICKHCGKSFQAKPSQAAKHCSRKCYNARRTAEIVTFTCDNCGKEATKTRPNYEKSKNLHFCNNECKTHYMQGENCPQWRGGRSKKPYPSKFNGENKFKDSIRKRDNYTCQVCGKTQKEVGRRLDIHHINYIKHDLAEHNLITLCRGCNARASHDEFCWQSYFRNSMVLRGLAPEEYANWP